MGLVRDEAGRVLLVETARRGWEPPGGQVERGEDLIAALAREVREESGCDVAVGRLVGVYSNVGPLGIVMFTFLCRHIGGAVCAGDECSAAGWFAPEEATRLVTNPAQAAKLRDALAADGVVYRAYTTQPEQTPQGLRYARYRVLREDRC
jgi:8-oxo-dGTP pyrophosphatase MutT (NUDIX family)